MDSISFTSRINFVNRANYEQIPKGTYIQFERLNKSIVDLSKNVQRQAGLNKIFHRLDVIKSKDFYTEDVRTCTAGGVIDTQTGESAGFHIFDDLYNCEHVEEILENIFDRVKKPDRALLIGSKKLMCSRYSIPIFEKIYDGISKRIKNVTIFREHVFPLSESSLNYSLKNDTWTIQSMYRPFFSCKDFEIESKEDLYKCFKEIVIANGDTLEFNAKI